MMQTGLELIPNMVGKGSHWGPIKIQKTLSVFVNVVLTSLLLPQHPLKLSMSETQFALTSLSVDKEMMRTSAGRGRCICSVWSES